MNNLLQSIDKMHTTPMGADRISRNIGVIKEDIVLWCKNATLQADLLMQSGKNWYVYKDGIAITVNAKSYTIITAHKIAGKVRIMCQTDYPCLKEFLYQAIFVPKDEAPPKREIIYKPEIFVYLKDFGKQEGDFGVVAEQNGQIIGAAWVRIISGYGHLDKNTPELAISILPEFRGYNIGTKLLKKLFDLLKINGYTNISLSVQNDNPAVRLYQRLGFNIINERPDNAGHEDYLMIKNLIKEI